VNIHRSYFIENVSLALLKSFKVLNIEVGKIENCVLQGYAKVIHMNFLSVSKSLPESTPVGPAALVPHILILIDIFHTNKRSYLNVISL
jgi:hypothetical protein